MKAMKFYITKPGDTFDKIVYVQYPYMRFQMKTMLMMANRYVKYDSPTMLRQWLKPNQAIILPNPYQIPFNDYRQLQILNLINTMPPEQRRL